MCIAYTLSTLFGWFSTCKNKRNYKEQGVWSITIESETIRA